jgi:sugar lactone lactonase YvrE
MIDRVELLYKDQLIERLYGENIYMLQDITVPQAKQSALTTLVGKNTITPLASYHIPLPFFVLKKGLPLLALDEPPRFRVVFQPSTYKNPIDVSLFVEYVYVSKAERDWFTSHEVVYMTQTFQRVQFRIPVTPSQTSYTFYTDLVNDVKELFWVIQSDAASNVYDYGTTDQLVNLRLTFNGVDRITPDYATAQYLRVAQGLEFHTRVPDGRYYMYSFALEPEMDQPTGSVNMSQVTRQQHTLTLAPSASERSLRIYAMSYNLMRVKDGEATMLYTEREGGNVPVTSFPGGQVGTGVDSYIRGTDVVNSPGTVSKISYQNSELISVNGKVQWSARIASTVFDQSAGIAIDSSGSFYVAGSYYSNPLTLYNKDGSAFGTTLDNSGFYDVFIAKYDTNGNVQWCARITGTENDQSAGIAVDASGSVYVTGYYASNPLTLYNKDGSAFATTLANSGFNDAFIAKYSTDGNVQWCARITGTGYDQSNGIAVDASGSVYVTGYYYSNPLTLYNKDGSAFGTTLTNSGSYDAFIAKYSTDGNVQWCARISGTGNEASNGIAVDASGSVYVTGTYTSNPCRLYNKDGSEFTNSLPLIASYDIFIAKYSTDGNVQWCTRIAGSTGFYNISYSIAVDGSGSIYITGYYSANPLTLYNKDGSAFGTTLANSGPYNILIAKYSTDGNVQWGARIAGSSGNSIGNSIAADASGNVYVTGYYSANPLTLYNKDGSEFGTTLTNSGSSDVFIAKYDTNGNVQWGSRIGGTEIDQGTGIVVDSSGSFYVTGSYYSNPLTLYNKDGSAFATTLDNSGLYDVFIAKYSS